MTTSFLHCRNCAMLMRKKNGHLTQFYPLLRDNLKNMVFFGFNLPIQNRILRKYTVLFILILKLQGLFFSIFHLEIRLSYLGKFIFLNVILIYVIISKLSYILDLNDKQDFKKIDSLIYSDTKVIGYALFSFPLIVISCNTC